MILKFHIQNYLDKSKKCHTWHSPAANFTYGTLKSGSDLQCGAPMDLGFHLFLCPEFVGIGLIVSEALRQIFR